MELLRISLDRNLSMYVHVGGITVGLALLFCCSYSLFASALSDSDGCASSRLTRPNWA